VFVARLRVVGLLAWGLLLACEPHRRSAETRAVAASPVDAHRVETPVVAPSTQAGARPVVVDAERCFDTPSCPAATAVSLYLSADDAGAEGVSCFRFYYGIGLTRDWVRARACFRRQVTRQGSCDAGSPDLVRLFLASMLLDGQGGAADPSGAASLLGDCFEDAAVLALRTRMTTGAPDGARTPLDFCSDVGGTTLSMGECAAVGVERRRAEGQLAEKALDARLSAEERGTANRARATWRAYVQREAAFEADQFRGGSLQVTYELDLEMALDGERTAALAKLDAYHPPGRIPNAPTSLLERTLQQARAGDSVHAGLCDTAMAAWKAYRDDEVALYVALFGVRFGASTVARDVENKLIVEQKIRLDRAAVARSLETP